MFAEDPWVRDAAGSGGGRRAARDDIAVLPGMEINCLVAPDYADAIHVLAVFPPDVGEVTIERIFAGKKVGEPSERTGKEAVRFDDLGELRERIQEIGGIFVLDFAEVAIPRRRSK